MGMILHLHLSSFHYFVSDNTTKFFVCVGHTLLFFYLLLFIFYFFANTVLWLGIVLLYTYIFSSVLLIYL